MYTSTIAIVSDDISCRQTMRIALSEASYAVLEYDHSMLEIPPGSAEVVCLHVADELGFQLLSRLLVADPELPVIVIGDAGMARRSIGAGAYDLVATPIDGTLLRNCVSRAVEKRQLAEKVRRLSSELASHNNAEVVPLRDLEREAIGRALRATKGSVTKAAKLLGIGRATLYRRLASPEMESLRPRRGFTPTSSPAPMSAGNGSHALG